MMRGIVGSLWVLRLLLLGRLDRGHPHAKYRVAEVTLAMTDARDRLTDEGLPRPLRRHPAGGVEVGPEGAMTVGRAGGEVVPGEDVADVPGRLLAPPAIRKILTIRHVKKSPTESVAVKLVPAPALRSRTK